MAGDNPTKREAFHQVDTAIAGIATKVNGIYIRAENIDHYGQLRQGVELEHARRPQLLIFPTLLRAMHLCLPGETQSLVCLGTLSPKTFWAFASEALEMDLDVSKEDESAIIQEPAVALKLYYRRRPADFSPEESGSYLISKSSAQGDDALAQLYDQQSLILRHQDSPHSGQDYRQAFETGFFEIHEWASNIGIISDDLLSMSTECLAHIWVELFDSYHDLDPISPQSPRNIWRTALASISVGRFFSNNGTLQMQTSSGRDLAEFVSPESSKAIKEAFESSLTSETANNHGALAQAALSDTLKTCQQFACLKVQCWVPKKQKECIRLIPDVLIALQSYFRSRTAHRIRLWPYCTPRLQQELDLKCTVGIYHSESVNEDFNDGSHISELLQSFMAKVDYDKSSCYLQLDRLPDGADITTLLTAQLLGDPEHSSSPQPSPFTKESFPSSGTTKFRTAASAMNRLRWDPAHAAVDYDVGYLDRFESDLIWKPLDNWERFTEEEEFIPEHRVRQITRRQNGVVVWDRAKRLDLTGTQ